MIGKKTVESLYGKYKVFNSEPLTELKLWCSYLNKWGDRFFIAAPRTDGLFVGYSYGNPQPSLFAHDGACVGYIDFQGVEHLDKRPEGFNLVILECEFRPWR